MKKQNVRTLALIVGAFTYLLIGAAVFDALESDHETEEKEVLKNLEKAFKKRHNVTDEEYERLRENIYRYKSYKGGVQWKFSGAFYFALTVITTIGYGHSTPRTIAGKMFFVAYGLVGIPLNLVMFQSIGERFNNFVIFLLSKIRRCIRRHGHRQHASIPASHVPGELPHEERKKVSQSCLTVVATILCTVTLFGGAAAFSHFEGWTYEDAFYFCFATLSTIGFGDFVALQNGEALQHRPAYVVFTILFILMGLTIFAAAVNLLVLRMLTMNTEDEKKDELEALAARKTGVHLVGDIIHANGGKQYNGSNGTSHKINGNPVRDTRPTTTDYEVSSIIDRGSQWKNNPTAELSRGHANEKQAPLASLHGNSVKLTQRDGLFGAPTLQVPSTIKACTSNQYGGSRISVKNYSTSSSETASTPLMGSRPVGSQLSFAKHRFYLRSLDYGPPSENGIQQRTTV